MDVIPTSSVRTTRSSPASYASFTAWCKMECAMLMPRVGSPPRSSASIHVGVVA